MARMVRKQLYIDERQEALLKEQADLTGRTESELIRNAIDALYDKNGARIRRMTAAEDMLRIFDKMAGVAEARGITGPHWQGREALYDPPRGWPKGR